MRYTVVENKKGNFNVVDTHLEISILDEHGNVSLRPYVIAINFTKEQAERIAFKQNQRS